jgi:hypothetical protein
VGTSKKLMSAAAAGPAPSKGRKPADNAVTATAFAPVLMAWRAFKTTPFPLARLVVLRLQERNRSRGRGSRTKGPAERDKPRASPAERFFRPSHLLPTKVGLLAAPVANLRCECDDAPAPELGQIWEYRSLPQPTATGCRGVKYSAGKSQRKAARL